MPKSTTNIRPATTGDTENGRSISVISSDFPRKLNFAMAHAAQIPKITFRGTLMAATISVNRMAARASGLFNEAKYAFHPWPNACAKTFTSGRNRNTIQNASAMEMRIHFTTGDSSVPRRDCRCVSPFRFLFTMPAISVLEAACPLFEQVDNREQDERK